MAATSALGKLARSVAVAALSGSAAGGIGSRIAMRISAVAAGPSLQGHPTEAGNLVGDITLGGSFLLFVLGGFIGVMGGLAFLALRPWLADAGRWKGLLFGVLILAMAGWTIIEGDNPDFGLFGPRALNVAMFAALFILFGVLLAPLFGWVDRTLPKPPFRRRFGIVLLPVDLSLSGLAIQVTIGFGLFLATLIVVATVGFGVGGGEGVNRAFFRTVLAYVLLALPLASVTCARATGRFQRLSDLRQRPAVMGTLIAVVAPPVMVGLFLDVRAIADIF